MPSLLDLAASHPSRTLAVGETLITQGREGGDLFILVEGELRVERDGVEIATISGKGTVIGEMAVILGTPSTATVKAISPTTVHVIRDAHDYLQTDPALSFQIAGLIAGRLNATSAYLVKLSRDHAGKPEGHLLGRILAALNGPGGNGDTVAIARRDLFDRSSGV